MEEYKSESVFFTQSQHSQHDDNNTISPNWLDSLIKATSGGAQHVFAREITDQGRRIYTKDLTHEQMIRYQQLQPKMERNFYEILLEDKPIKLFYDIDITPAIENLTLLNQLVNEVINITITSMQELYNIGDIYVA